MKRKSATKNLPDLPGASRTSLFAVASQLFCACIASFYFQLLYRGKGVIDGKTVGQRIWYHHYRCVLSRSVSDPDPTNFFILDPT
jgi:hypothetical protein